MTRPGDVLAGKYRLTSELGTGGMGSVWAAEHLVLHCPVAVKLIEPARSGGEDRSAHFLREARLAAALNSQHVVKIFDYGLAESLPFIAMELLQGETLRQRLQRRGALGLEETHSILRQIALGVERAHQAGIVHRDLKPENIFIVSSDETELVKVLDFGIAKSVAAAALESIPAMTPTGAVLGTPHYMSPEQAVGSKELDQRTDVWSLGVLTCECLLGQPPFRGGTLGALIIAICSKPLPVPSELGAVPPGFDAWFERACARDPQQRFASVRELSSALSSLRASEQPLARTQPLPAQRPMPTAQATFDARARSHSLEASEPATADPAQPAVTPRGVPHREAQATGAAPFERTMSAAEVAPEPRTRTGRRWLTIALLVLAGAGAVAVTQRFWAPRAPASAAAGDPSPSAPPEPAPSSTASSSGHPAPSMSRAALEPRPSSLERASGGAAADEQSPRVRGDAELGPSAERKMKPTPAREPRPRGTEPRPRDPEPRRPVPTAPTSKPDDPYNLGF